MAEKYSLGRLGVNLETVGFLDFGSLLRVASRVAVDPGWGRPAPTEMPGRIVGNPCSGAQDLGDFMTGSSGPSVWATILAGGAGHRFWPLSTESRPKQLLPLGGAEPLVVEALGRARSLVPIDRLRVLTGQELMAPIQALTGLPDDAFMVEPRARGTGPVLFRAAWETALVDADAVMISLHSDHIVRPADKFRDVLEAAVEIARREGLLMTVAIPPDRPETGFGYISPGRTLVTGDEHRAYCVDEFVEKPDCDTATAYLAAGYRWNSGIFVWPARVFLDEVREHAPEIACALPCLERGDIAGFFDETAAISVDEAVLERSARVGSIDATFQWDDMGSWAAWARHRSSDEEGNIAEGDVHLVQARNNLVVGNAGRLVLLGVDDLLVVQTEHTTLVMPRSEAPHLKQYLARLPRHAVSDDSPRSRAPGSGS